MVKYTTEETGRVIYSCALLAVEFPGKESEKKRDGVRTVNFNYPLFQAAFGQLIPWLPSLCGHRRRGARCSQDAVSQDSEDSII